MKFMIKGILKGRGTFIAKTLIFGALLSLYGIFRLLDNSFLGGDGWGTIFLVPLYLLDFLLTLLFLPARGLIHLIPLYPTAGMGDVLLSPSYFKFIPVVLIAFNAFLIIYIWNYLKNRFNLIKSLKFLIPATFGTILVLIAYVAVLHPAGTFYDSEKLLEHSKQDLYSQSNYIRHLIPNCSGDTVPYHYPFAFSSLEPDICVLRGFIAENPYQHQGFVHTTLRNDLSGNRHDSFSHISDKMAWYFESVFDELDEEEKKAFYISFLKEGTLGDYYDLERSLTGDFRLRRVNDITEDRRCDIFIAEFKKSRLDVSELYLDDERIKCLESRNYLPE